jgi:D-arabinose 1-dehydrogenase-like Zn-dependent alcohol dehydrogenase
LTRSRIRNIAIHDFHPRIGSSLKRAHTRDSVISQHQRCTGAGSFVRSGAKEDETFPLEKAAEAYELMMSNKARFRVVITPGN